MMKPYAHPQYHKATSGNVTAEKRQLVVAVLG